VATYFYIFVDGSPGLETSELTDDKDAVGFAQIVAEEIGRENRKAAPPVTVRKRDGDLIQGTEGLLTCQRCAHAQRLSGVERRPPELCFMFVCTDCGKLETRTVTPAPSRTSQMSTKT
jgi:hypothetical protein